VDNKKKACDKNVEDESKFLTGMAGCNLIIVKVALIMNEIYLNGLMACCQMPKTGNVRLVIYQRTHDQIKYGMA
jgi:hypothetical protein